MDIERKVWKRLFNIRIRYNWRNCIWNDKVGLLWNEVKYILGMVYCNYLVDDENILVVLNYWRIELKDWL